MNIFRISRLAALGAAASAALLVAQPATVGATGAGGGVVVGQGTITPALSTTAQPVSGGFAGTSVGVGASTVAGGIVQIDGACNFNFASEGGGDTIELGNGTASGSCTGGVGGANLTASALTYFRVGAAVEIDGSGTANGDPVSFTAYCWFQATSVPPSSFALVCKVFITPIPLVTDPA